MMIRTKKKINKERLLKTDYLFKNKLFGHQQTTEHVYEWNSVNVQGGVGDTVIDLSKTILPKGDAVISDQEYHWQYHRPCTVWHRNQGPSFCHCGQGADF